MRATICVSVAILCGLLIEPPLSAVAQDQSSLRYFGILKANPEHLETDRLAGVNLVEIGVRWDRYEPQRGIFDAQYQKMILDRIDQYRRAGFRISVATATQYSPAWILADTSLQAKSQFADDYSGMANLFFDQAIRDEAERFIRDVVEHAGHVDYYRIGLSHHGEIVLPVASRGQWWAMDPKAQGDLPGRPSTIPDPPFRHWYPGQPLNGRAATIAELEQWWNWYFSVLVDAHNWEAAAIRRAGFAGLLQYVIPGPGLRPSDMERAFRRRLDLDPADPFHLINVGVAWHLLLERLEDRNALVDISSVYDKSGAPRGNGCAAADKAVDYLHDPSVNTWSSTRWLAFQAQRNGFRTIGENPGNNSAEEMRRALKLAESCRLEGLQWAFDDELYDGKNARIEDFAEEIRRIQMNVRGQHAH